MSTSGKDATLRAIMQSKHGVDKKVSMRKDFGSVCLCRSYRVRMRYLAARKQ